MAFSTRVIIQDQPFDLSAEYQLLKSASLEVGALAIFVGTVRDLNDGDDVVGLKLEHYPGMTEKEISKILSEAGGLLLLTEFLKFLFLSSQDSVPT